jgi:hypothetical protein
MARVRERIKEWALLRNHRGLAVGCARRTQKRIREGMEEIA